MEYSKTHPLLHLPCVQKLFQGEVMKINRNGNQQHRFLLITNVGLFLLKKRSFPAGYSCSHAISYENIKKITLTKEYFEFKELKRFTLVSNDAPKIISTILHVRSVLFGDTEFIFDQTFSENDKNIFQQTKCTYLTEYPVADRFLARSINSITFPVIEQVYEIYKQLQDLENAVITVTTEILNLPTAQAFIDTISTVTFPHELVIANGDYLIFIEVLQKIVQNSDRVEKITFNNVSFTNVMTDNSLFKGHDHQTSITALAWKHCDFSSLCTKNFLEDFIHYNGKIFSILCEDCVFSEVTLQSFFHSLYDAKSVHEIEYFSMGGIDIYDLFQVLLIQFVNNSYVLTNQNLHCLSISRSNIDTNFVLSGVTLFDTGIEELCMNGCNFTKPIEKQGILNYYSISLLDFSETSFTFESLISLFQNVKSTISALILNQLAIDKSDLKQFYLSLSSFDFPQMERFEFSKNIVPEENCRDFFDFIIKMINLSALDISYSIVANKNTTKYLVDFVSNLSNLNSLTLKGAKETSFGEEFIEILKVLPPTVCVLDITGQRIGDNGMTQLSKIISESLQCVKFGNTNCSIKYLCDVLEAILSSCVISAEWNQTEINSTLARASDQTEWAAKIRQLKVSFEEKFGNASQNSLNTTMIMTNNYSTSRKVQLVSVGNDLNLKLKATLDYRAIIKSQNDAALMDILEECIGKEKAAICPLENTLVALEKETSFLVSPQIQF